MKDELGMGKRGMRVRVLVSLRGVTEGHDVAISSVMVANPVCQSPTK